MTAVRWNGKVSDDERIAWKHSDFGADVPTPVVSGSRVYVCGDKGDIHCLDATTGKVIWKDALQKIATHTVAHPLSRAAICISHAKMGTTFVIKDADKLEVVAENKVDSSTVSTPCLSTEAFCCERLTLSIAFNSRSTRLCLRKTIK